MLVIENTTNKTILVRDYHGMVYELSPGERMGLETNQPVTYTYLDGTKVLDIRDTTI